MKQEAANLTGLPKEEENRHRQNQDPLQKFKSKSSYPLLSWIINLTRRLTLYTATPPDQIK